MNIIVTTGGNVPSIYAHSFNVMKMAQGFYKLGNSVKLVVPLSFPLLIKRIKIKDIYSFYGIDRGIKVKYIPVFSLRGLKQSNDFVQFDYSAAKYCKKLNVDLAYCRSYRIPYHCVKMGVPTIIETHTPNYRHPDLQKIYEVSNEPNFKGLVTISDVLKQNFIDAGVPKDKILVLQDGVDIEDFQKIKKSNARVSLGLPQDQSIAMYCGHLYKGRGIEFILHAAKALKEIMFIIVGGFSSDISHWKGSAMKIGLSNVVFTGFVEHRIVPLYLKAADVLLMPYTRDTPTYKWMSPLKLFEYMAAGRPIIATDLKSIKEKIEHMETGILVKEKSDEEIANAIRLIFGDKALADKLSQNAEKEAEKHTWKKRTEVILNELLGLKQ